jgi:hypothetical protein
VSCPTPPLVELAGDKEGYFQKRHPRSYSGRFESLERKLQCELELLRSTGELICVCQGLLSSVRRLKMKLMAKLSGALLSGF